MPLRDYSTKAAYDADYRFWLPAEITPLPPTELVLSGNAVTDTLGAWTRPKVGGRLRLSLGREHVRTLNRSEVKITAILGNDYVTDNPRPWPLATSFTTTRSDQVIYVVPAIECHYDGPFFQHPTLGVRPVVRGVFDALGVGKTDRIVLVGVGMGFEVEAARALGYASCVGTDTSAFIQAALIDTLSEDAELRALLTNAGLDPDVGEGADMLTAWKGDSIRLKSGLVEMTDLTKKGERNAVEKVIGGAPDWIISSFVLSVLSDAEAVVMSADMHSFGTGTVAHYTPVLQPGARQRAGDNWKPAAQWKALLAPDLIVSGATYGVI